jgi:HEAT repeat protein
MEMRFITFMAAAAFAQAQSGRPSVTDLIAVLQQRDATLHAKARACQQLGEFGSKEAVSALAALLPDKALSAYARSGLEGIPDASAADALRAALKALKGDLLVGAVNSLGVLRDAASVDALSGLASGPEAAAAKAALLALGRISNEKAITALQRAMSIGPAALRPDAASGILLAAEAMLAAGNNESARALYDAVRNTTLPASHRAAATRGAILARKSGGVDLLVALLKTEDREMRNVALRATREMRRDELARALLAELDTAKPEVQAQLVEAIADCCRDAQSMRAIRSRTSSENPEVRHAALKALGKTGDRMDAPVLLKALLNAADSSVAAESLARVHGAEVDTLIMEALAAATAPASRVALISVLDARPPARAATKQLLMLAGDTDVNVSVAALRALRSFAGIDELPALIELTRTYKDGAQRGAAEMAIYYAGTVTKDSVPAGELLLNALNKSTEDLDKASFIRTLSMIGYRKALPSITPSLRDSNSWLVTVTIDSLGGWPDPAPASDLLRFVETSSNAGVRTRALTAGIQLVTPPFGAAPLPDATVAEFYRRARDVVKSPEEKRLLISGLGRWRTADSIRLLAPYLDDTALKTAAANAIVDAAQVVAAGPDRAVLQPLLPRMSGTGDQALQDRIENLRSTIAARGAAEAGDKPATRR